MYARLQPGRRLPEAGDVDTARAILTLDDGTLATVSATRYNGAGYDVRMEVAGERASRGRPGRPYARAPPSTGRVPARQAVDGVHGAVPAAYGAELAAFLEVVAAGQRPNPCTVAEALQALRIAEACELSRAESHADE